METASRKSTAQVSQVAAGISARLQQLTRNPPELSAYLKEHSQLLRNVLKPRGLAYEMSNGKAFQRVHAYNIGELNLRENAAQDAAFRNAAKQAAEQNKVQLLQPLSGPVQGRNTLSQDSAVSEGSVQVFNETPYQHLFIPISADGNSMGALHVWFDSANAETVATRQSLLISFSSEISGYLRARRSIDLAQEVTRLNTYSHLLEDLAGDIELESVAWSVVNFARETVECERVSIFSVKDYPRNGSGIPEFEILASSGLKRPHPRSEHSEVLKAVVRDLAKLTLQEEEKPSPQESLPEPKADIEAEEAEDAQVTPVSREESAPAKEEEEKKAPPMPTGKRPKFRLIFTYRDPDKAKERSHAINHYFDSIPMNWATTLPLFDRDGSVCGILLFEGQKSGDKAQKSFLPMSDLAYSGGRAVGTALYWQGRRTLRMAQSIEGFKQRAGKTPRRRIFMKFGLPTIAVIALLAMPIEFKIRGNALLRPTLTESLPAAISERLDQIHIREGQTVEKGALLAELDTRDRELQLRKARQDAQRYWAESDMARSQNDEARMQIAMLNARQSETEAMRLEREIELSKIRAPFGGVITGPLNINQRRGQVLRLGEPVVELARLDDWEVRIDVREQDLVHLSESLQEIGAVPIRMKFNADSTTEHKLEVTDPGQLAYGLETRKGEYTFAVVLPMSGNMENADQFRVGYTGNAIFEMGSKPLVYVFFRDFAHFIKVRWF